MKVSPVEHSLRFDVCVTENVWSDLQGFDKVWDTIIKDCLCVHLLQETADG